jgi:Fe-S-cluster-containing dehydrogenase component
MKLFSGFTTTARSNPGLAANEFFIDPSRCIGCQACFHACGECESHRGHSMIHLDYVDRSSGVQTVPVVCMHCEDPTCAKVCPADAIKKDAQGVVHSAAKPRCVACSNCVLACPFGVPKMKSDFELMMKCDLCYDRTSQGKKPMCATVCPSGALYFGPRSHIEQFRREQPINEFRFGAQTVKTKVNLMSAAGTTRLASDITRLPLQRSKPDGDAPSRSGAPDAADFAVWDDPFDPLALEGSSRAARTGVPQTVPTRIPASASASRPLSGSSGAEPVP